MMTLNKRGKIVLFFIISLVIIFIIIHFLPKNYKDVYKIGKFSITESYNKKEKIYTFMIKKGKEKYYFVSDKKYTTSRNNISSIKEYKKRKSKCIVVESNIIDNNIMCIDDDKYIDYHLLDKILPKKYYKKIKNVNKKYNDINIKYLDEKDYYIWDYKNFIKIGKENKKIPLLKNDLYSMNIATISNNYLVIADYTKKYNFKKFILINLKNNEKSEISYKDDISFQSRFLGTYKNNLYIIDEKNMIEYEINLKKKEINKIASKNDDGFIYENDVKKNYSLKKIVNSRLKFDMNKLYKYEIIDNNLYMKMKNNNKKILLSKKNIKKIVYNKNDEVYYIVDDKLYKYDKDYGEIEILTNYELNFNYDNVIFIN